MTPFSTDTSAGNGAGRPFSSRKQAMLQLAERMAAQRDAWIEQHSFFFNEDWRYLRFLVPAGKRVLDLGCGTGALLNELQPSYGVGVDFSQAMIEQARKQHPNLSFICGDVERLREMTEIQGRFDVILLSDTLGALDDCLDTIRSLHRLCGPETRVVVVYHSRIWEPLSRVHGHVSGKRLSLPQNWLSSEDICNLLSLSDFDVIKREWRMLMPLHLFGLGRLINRFVATLPGIRKLCLRNYVVARPQPQPEPRELSATVVVPCRNERGNIQAAVDRLPRFCQRLEIIFVEGGSSDGTWDEIQRVIAAYPHLDIKAFKQAGKGKGDAVRKGFAEASGDVLFILDADLTTAPEDMPKFYEALSRGRGEFINGSRLVYPMETQAMRFLNQIANYVFAVLFSYLLNQRYTDTLCGTKVLLRRHYEDIASNRAYFGDFDPFGDFDLIFGANKLNLKTAEIPIRYAAREYGDTNISRFRHGLLLLRMVGFAFIKLKAF